MRAKTAIAVVHAGSLFFVVREGPDWRPSAPVSLDSIADDSIRREDIPGRALGAKNRLLVVPDYWFENAYYPFPSKKKSLIEDFLARKIAEQYPDTPDACHYFDYALTQTLEKTPALYAFYVKEAIFFKLMETLEDFGLSPQMVTAPGYLWQRRLAATLPSFANSGQALVHVMRSLCYLAIYFEGNFLFSRLIALPEASPGAVPPLEEVVYEITQSLYLFSQKVKKEVEHIHVYAENGRTIVGELSSHFRGKLHDLAEDGLTAGPLPDETPGPAASFFDSGLAVLGHLCGVTHIARRREEEWRRFQYFGIGTGGTVAMILLAVLGYMYFFADPLPTNLDPAAESRATELEGRLTEYRQTLGQLVEDAEKPAPDEILTQVSVSLPEDFLLKKAAITGEQGGKVEVEGWVEAASAARLEQVLSELLANLHRRIPASNSMQLRDIEFSRDKDEKTQHKNLYLVHFNFTLP